MPAATSLRPSARWLRESTGLALAMVVVALLVGAIFAPACQTPAPTSPPAPGALIVIGGGHTPEAAVARALELSGGSSARVAILAHASSLEQRGVASAEMFLEAGAAEAYVLDDLEAPRTRQQLARATLVWMPGGSQNRLMKALREAELLPELRAMHARGVTFGGTSAGAAVQSSWMITGEAELEAVVAAGTELAEGLGLWSAAIVDQHALKRRRLQRLLSAVLDHPELVGIAVDERTALVVRGTHLEVLGESAVVVLDARRARVEPATPGAPHGARNLTLHVLRAGMTLELDE